MVYNELHYERIDFEKSKQFLMDIITDFESAETAEKQIAAIKEVDHFSRDYMTYNAMASLNFSRNINDEGAKDEKESVSYTHLTLPTITEV